KGRKQLRTMPFTLANHIAGSCPVFTTSRTRRMPRVPKKAKTEQEVAAFRQQVCDVATGLFIERGPGNVTMRQIAAGVGVSPMTPYRYFRDKDEILAAVRAAAYNRFASSLERAVKRATTARAKARAIGDAYVRF